VSNFDEKIIERLKRLEREVDRLRVKERPAGGTWQDWKPTVTGWAAGYDYIARYCKVGKMCFVYLHISGTSNSVNARATLPLKVPGEKANFQVPVYTNNSATDFVGGKCLAQVRPNDKPAGGQVWFWLNGSESNWTASGTKTVTVSFFYEVA
jgi:hypothetical protein